MKNQLLDYRGLTELAEYMKEYISDVNPIRPYASYTLFPTVGDQKAIYIDTSTDTIYRWDDNNIKYYALAFNTEDQFIMQCGNAKG